MSGLNIAIVGAGGVGGYIGAKLTQNFYDVTMIARGKHYEAIKRDGLKIIDYKDEFSVSPKIVKEASNEIFDVVFITTKSYDFEEACKSVENCIDENTLIIPLSNGVDHKKELQNYLDKGIFCDGTIYIISHIEKPGVINRSSYTFYLLYGSDIKDERLLVLREILNQSGLRTNYTNYIEQECWKKYLFISAMGTLTSYFKKPMGYVVGEELETFIDVLIEIKKVANKKGIDLENKDIEKCVKQANHAPYESKTSMQLDFENGKNTELESLCGYIVSEALKYEIEVPVMKKIYEELKGKNN